jgi:hypothetical protein
MITCIARNTETRLRKIIKGEVKCFAKGNRIYCDINTCGFSHRITVQYTDMEVYSGIASSDRTTELILRLHQKYLNELFFKY